MADPSKPIIRDTLMPKAPKRGPGRPPLEEPLTPVTSWVSPSLAKRLDRIATKHDLSVSTLVRQLLIVRLRNSNFPTE